MSIPCEVINDLLPLYHDGVCSNESKTIVDEHLAYCEKCNVELQEMDKALPIIGTEQNLKDAEAVRMLSRRWKKGMFKSILKGVFITIGIITALALILYIFVGFRIVVI